MANPGTTVLMLGHVKTFGTPCDFIFNPFNSRSENRKQQQQIKNTDVDLSLRFHSHRGFVFISTVV